MIFIKIEIIFDIFQHFCSAPYTSVSFQERTIWNDETCHNWKICRSVFRVSTLPSRKYISSMYNTGLRGWEDDVKYDCISQNMYETIVFKKFSPLLASCQALFFYKYLQFSLIFSYSLYISPTSCDQTLVITDHKTM